MKATFRNLAVSTLIGAGGAGVLGWSAAVVSAQSACIVDCRDKGWAFSQCSRYCETRYGEPNYAKRGPRVYGYTSRIGGGCGQYGYLKDGACVDVRTNPPGRY